MPDKLELRKFDPIVRKNLLRPNARSGDYQSHSNKKPGNTGFLLLYNAECSAPYGSTLGIKVAVSLAMP